jgi:hypothetical protein
MIEVNESNVSKIFTRIAVAFGDEEFDKIYEDVLFYLKLQGVNDFAFDSIQSGFNVYSKGNQNGISQEDLNIIKYNKFVLKTRNVHNNFGSIDVNTYISNYFDIQFKIGFLYIDSLKLNIHLIPKNPKFKVHDEHQNMLMSNKFFHDKYNIDDLIDFFSNKKEGPFYVIDEFGDNLVFKNKIVLSIRDLKDKLFNDINIVIEEDNFHLFYAFLLNLSKKVFGFILEKGIKNEIALTPVSSMFFDKNTSDGFFDTLLALECFMSIAGSVNNSKLGNMIDTIFHTNLTSQKEIKEISDSVVSKYSQKKPSFNRNYAHCMLDFKHNRDLSFNIPVKGILVEFLHRGNLNQILLMFSNLTSIYVIDSVFCNKALIYNIQDSNINKYGDLWHVYLTPRNNKTDIDINIVLQELQSSRVLNCEMIY